MDKILGEDGPARRRKRFSLNEYEGNRLFELREYYEKDGEFRPTRKGINLNRDNFMELKRVFDRDEDIILEWLRIGYVPEEVLRYQQAMEEARQKNFHLVGNVMAEEVDNFRDNHLFHVSHQGGTDVVQINTSNKFAQAITSEELAKLSTEEIRGLIIRIFAAYGRARTLLMNSPTTTPELFFESVEYDWSKFLEDFVKERKE